MAAGIVGLPKRPCSRWNGIVVSTPVPSALRLSSVVRIAENQAAFLSAIAASLTEDPNAAERRLEAARSHTWEDRVAQKSRIVLRRLAEKAGQQVSSEPEI